MRYINLRLTYLLYLQCHARPTVIPATSHHRPLVGTKLYCLVTEAQVCEQLVQGRYSAMRRPGVEPATCWSQVQRHGHYVTKPHLSASNRPSSMCVQVETFVKIRSQDRELLSWWRIASQSWLDNIVGRRQQLNNVAQVNYRTRCLK